MTKEQILDAVAAMSVLELSELVKEMEEKFGVSAAAAAVAVAAAPAAAALHTAQCLPAPAQPQCGPVPPLRTMPRGRSAAAAGPLRLPSGAGHRRDHRPAHRGPDAAPHDHRRGLRTGPHLRHPGQLPLTGLRHPQPASLRPLPGYAGVPCGRGGGRAPVPRA